MPDVPGYNQAMRTLLIIGLTLIAAGAASGQANGPGPGDPAVEPDRVYHVELIVFAYNAGDPGEENFRHGLEQLPPGPAPRLLRLPSIELERVFDAGLVAATQPAAAPDTQSAATSDTSTSGLGASGLEQTTPGDRLELIEHESGPRTSGAAQEEILPGEFRLLGRAELELGEARARLDRLGAYNVLGHAGWAQVGVDTDRSVAIDLRHFGITNPTGTVEVSLRRFLRVALDLEYFDGDGSLWEPAEFPGLAPLAYAASYRLTTERTAIRRDDLHYIDHPLFGVLVRITRAPEIEEDDLAAGSRPVG